MASGSFVEWRQDVRSRIDGLQLHYDGLGEFSSRHATAYQCACNRERLWKVEVLETSAGEAAEPYVYGDNMPLTRKMAVDIAKRFVTGRKIPKALEWR